MVRLPTLNEPFLGSDSPMELQRTHKGSVLQFIRMSAKERSTRREGRG